MADAGWYPDPEGRPDHVRWWDGRAWAGDTDATAVADLDVVRADLRLGG